MYNRPAAIGGKETDFSEVARALALARTPSAAAAAERENATTRSS
jgi:hypothetical protein